MHPPGRGEPRLQEARCRGRGGPEVVSAALEPVEAVAVVIGTTGDPAVENKYFITGIRPARGTTCPQAPAEL